MFKLHQEGIIIQNFCSKKFQYEVGENIQGIEIKLDRRSLETKRICIEVAEKRPELTTWMPSGILRNDNTRFYIVGNDSYFYLFSRKLLKQLYHSRKYQLYEHPNQGPTIRNFFLTDNEAEKYSIDKFIF